MNTSGIAGDELIRLRSIFTWALFCSSGPYQARSSGAAFDSLNAEDEQLSTTLPTGNTDLSTVQSNSPDQPATRKSGFTRRSFTQILRRLRACANVLQPLASACSCL